jgi:hypothetical protein
LSSACCILHTTQAYYVFFLEDRTKDIGALRDGYTFEKSSRVHNISCDFLFGLLAEKKEKQDMVARYDVGPQCSICPQPTGLAELQDTAQAQRSFRLFASDLHFCEC